MRLRSCYIAGFGKFKDRAFDLSQNIVVIKEENGWGKTTLAAFVECMLFGMDSGRTKAVENSDRIKYAPFAGGAYGGMLELVAGGRVYRIERTFSQTPAGDTVKVYDGNNTPVSAFTGASVGELLLGVSRESFKRSAYIPQEKRDGAGLPEDMKGRLLALLTDSETGNGAAAIEKLDAAERALRAKRKPAKGKLDIIDERLLALAREKDDCLAARDEAAALKLRIDERTARLREISERLKVVSEKIEQSTRAEERRAARSAYSELQANAERAKAEKARLCAFFKDNDPRSVNTDGLTAATTEFYAIKEALGALDLGATADGAQREESLKIRLEALEKTIASYETVLNAERATDKERKKLKREKRAVGRKHKWTTPIVVLGMLLTILGGVNIAPTPALGYPLFFVGLAGLVFGLWRMIVSAPSGGKRRRGVSAVREEYENAVAEAEELRAQLAALQRAETPTEDTEQKRERARALETAIVRFLENFAFGEPVYDYRAAVRTLKENIARYEECERVLSGRAELSPLPDTAIEAGNADELKRTQRSLEREKETLTAERARLGENRQTKEKRAFAYYDYEAEETRLKAEKARLEKRLAAIRGAREALLRARENMAGRYLIPVQRACREYLRFMGYEQGGEALRFAADGAPVLDEQGGMRALAYYSAGVKELVGFCMRIALATLVFTKEPPPLVLDDPFVNLDDDKTARAKAFVAELSKRYQIVYFTCKEERRL